MIQTTDKEEIDEDNYLQQIDQKQDEADVYALAQDYAEKYSTEQSWGIHGNFNYPQPSTKERKMLMRLLHRHEFEFVKEHVMEDLRKICRVD